MKRKNRVIGKRPKMKRVRVQVMMVDGSKITKCNSYTVYGVDFDRACALACEGLEKEANA